VPECVDVDVSGTPQAIVVVRNGMIANAE